MEAWLSQRRGGRVRLIIPQRGEKYRLLGMAQENARLQLASYQQKQAKTPAILITAKQELGLQQLPRRIEAFDVSNIQGNVAVGSMVVWEEDSFNKAAYRRFKIKGVAQVDDYAMLAEVLCRRYSKLTAQQQHPPDLILVDGGKGQLNTALKVLHDLGLEHIPVLGLAKRQEDIFLPGRKQPLKLPSHSSTRHLLQRIRDEAHRFALSFHRLRRKKRSFASPLDGIPGIGEKRKSLLMIKYRGLDKIREAPEKELAEIVGQKAARELKKRLKDTS
jgi:excinuclease ABC subunit C